MKYTKSDMKNLVILKKYTDERLDELLAGRESLNEREFSELDIPIDDRLLLLGRLCADERNTVTRRIAKDALQLWKRPVPKVVMRYLDTGDEELRVDAAGVADWLAGNAASAALAASGKAGVAAWESAMGVALADERKVVVIALAAAMDAENAAKNAAKHKYLGWMVELCESRENG
jgi:hypothetical protein